VAARIHSLQFIAELWPPQSRAHARLGGRFVPVGDGFLLYYGAIPAITLFMESYQTAFVFSHPDDLKKAEEESFLKGKNIVH